MSLYVSLYTGLSAIRAGQAGIGTVSHNISNVATPGFTRQRTDLVAAEPYDSPVGLLGTGVDVDGIRRLRDQFVDARVRTTAADFAYHDVRSQLLARTEAVMGEPDDGLTTELNALWNAFDDLANAPDDTATRRQVLNQLEAVTNRVNGVATAWDQLQADTDQRLQASVDELDQLLTQVADINQRVARSEPGTVSNDLLDQRDLAVDRIAELTGGRATTDADGVVTITLGSTGTALVDPDGARPVALATTAPFDLEVDGVAVTGEVRGEIGALHEFVHTTIVDQRADLATFANDLATALNQQHALGALPDDADADTLPEPGGALLTAVSPTAPGQPLLQTTGLGPADLAPGTTTAALDGRNAAALSGLRDSSLNQRLDDLVIDLGTRVAGAERSAQAAGDVAVAAEVARQSQHGVSMDEEMVDLVRYQRQLEAASRVMTAVDQALDTLVNRVGIVGR